MQFIQNWKTPTAAASTCYRVDVKFLDADEAEVEIADESWADTIGGPSETPWSGDDDRSSDFSDEHADDYKISPNPERLRSALVLTTAAANLVMKTRG